MSEVVLEALKRLEIAIDGMTPEETLRLYALARDNTDLRRELELLRRIVTPLSSVVSESAVRAHLDCYVMGCEMLEALAEYRKMQGDKSD